MTLQQFKNFRSYLIDADKQDDVWWAGYAFLALTEKQCKEVYKILEAKGFDKKEDGTILMPSGLGIRK